MALAQGHNDIAELLTKLKPVSGLWDAEVNYTNLILLHVPPHLPSAAACHSRLTLQGRIYGEFGGCQGGVLWRA